MTVDYNRDISSGNQPVLFRLLAKWKGSLYKLVWVDLLIYVCLYYLLNLIYRFTLNEDQKRVFEEVVKFCDSMKNNIPLSFLLGFFVAGVIARWWKMYYAIPWLNRMAFVAQSFIIGNGEQNSKEARYTLMRYMALGWILLMRQISDQIKIRFRLNNQVDSSEETSIRDILQNINLDRRIQATFRKIITEQEIQTFEKIAIFHQERTGKTYVPEYWLPLQWGVRFVQKCFVHGYISDPRTMIAVIEEIDNIRKQMQNLQIYSSILIPLVYTQVVIIAVYSFFLCQLFAAQFVDPKQKIVGHEVDFYFPVFTIFQFLFLMGWLKVAMCVMNPFGDDDEDFDTSRMLDDNLEIAFRSAGSGSYMFPDKLQPAAVSFRKQETAKEDNLPIFQQLEREEMNNVQISKQLDEGIQNESIIQETLRRVKRIVLRSNKEPRYSLGTKRRETLMDLFTKPKVSPQIHGSVSYQNPYNDPAEIPKPGISNIAPKPVIIPLLIHQENEPTLTQETEDKSILLTEPHSSQSTIRTNID